MWQIENHTPFGAGGTFVRNRNGAETWLVAVRASYLLKSNGNIAVCEQTDPLLAPEFLGEPGESSLKYDSDLELTKPGTDVILHGHAYAPDDKPTKKMGVMLKVGPVEKMLVVTGDRYWEKGALGIKRSAPIEFEKMSLIYENAYGGTDTSEITDDGPVSLPENPLGTGFALKKKNLIGCKAPNIEYYNNGKGRPACFGPVSRHWMPRSQYAGTYDEQTQQDPPPFLPDDLDDRFFYCAPQDQQVPGYLNGGEIVEIFGMSPRGPLKFVLPSLDLTFKTVLGSKIKEHKAKLHTVILEPDIPGFSVVWHTSLDVQDQGHLLEKTIIT